MKWKIFKLLILCMHVYTVCSIPAFVYDYDINAIVDNSVKINCVADNDRLVHNEIKKLCSSRKKRFTDEPIFLAALIAFYTCLNHVTVTRPGDYNNPITELALMDVTFPNGISIQVPAYVRATIYPRHVQRNVRRQNGPEVQGQMRLMGYDSARDDIFHLLAHSLGGTEALSNLIPFATAVNRHTSRGDRDRKKTLEETQNPLSYWRSNEMNIQRFLQGGSGRRVEWRLGVVYNDDVSTGRVIDMQPTYFVYDFTLYNSDGSISDASDQIVYENSNTKYCPWSEYRRE